MFYRILSVFCIALLLTACSAQEKQPSKEVSTEVKEKPYARKITDEEQKYIDLVLKEDYNKLFEETKNQSNEVQKDYNNIAYIMNFFKKVKELEGIDDNEYASKISQDYSSIIAIVGEIKYIPDKIKPKIDEVKNYASSKASYYSNLDNVNLRTVDPQPVTIGMTQDEVLTKGWGKPNEINKTTTANGVSEQWVYDDYKYLYFEDGILVTIQE